MAVELGRVRDASGTDTHDLRVCFRQQRHSSNAQSRCACAQADATTDQTTAQPIAAVAGWIRRRRTRETGSGRAGEGGTD